MSLPLVGFRGNRFHYWKYLYANEQMEAFWGPASSETPGQPSLRGGGGRAPRSLGAGISLGIGAKPSQIGCDILWMGCEIYFAPL